MKTYHTFSSRETQTLGAVVAEEIMKSSASAAKVIALRGDLGAGKTTFTQGFLRALGVRGRVTSPTFVLMKRFALSLRAKVGKKNTPRFTNAYHIDAYRFRAASEAEALGLMKILKDPQAIVLIEWPERLKGILPKSRTDIYFRHSGRESERLIKIS